MMTFCWLWLFVEREYWKNWVQSRKWAILLLSFLWFSYEEIIIFRINVNNFFSVCTIEDRGIDEIVLDETIDCQVIELLRDEILPHSHEIPHQFILNVVIILNKGSIHSATTTNVGCDAELKLREEFAKTCFETLLQFSLLDDQSSNGCGNGGGIGLGAGSGSTAINNSLNNNNNANTDATINEGGVAGRLAVTALLHRFQEVLKKFNDDERQSGKCPLPKYRLSEISFVLKAVATLIVSMKKAPPAKGLSTLIFSFRS